MARRRRPEYIECKTLGHSWDEFNPSVAGDKRSRHRLTLRCTRCKTTRFDHLDASGELEGREYSYPDGYRDAKDEKPSRAALRLMLVKR